MTELSEAERIIVCAKYLRSIIPPPPPPPVKHQKSFATLSAGQHVESLAPFVSGGVTFPAGTRFVVTKPTNLGVTLDELSSAPEFKGVTHIQMNTREWKSRFKRVRKPAKKRKKK